MNITESKIKNILRKYISEQENERYMFFSNLEQMRRQCDFHIVTCFCNMVIHDLSKTTCLSTQRRIDTRHIVIFLKIHVLRIIFETKNNF